MSGRSSAQCQATGAPQSWGDYVVVDTYIEKRLSWLEEEAGDILPWRAFPYLLLSVWDMRIFLAHDFLDIARNIQEFLDWIRAHPNPDKHCLSDEDKKLWVNNLHFVRPKCEEVDLDGAVDQIDRVLSFLQQENITFRQLSESLSELRNRIRDQLKRIQFFYVPQERVKYYAEPMKGWEKIIEKWGETTSDIEEASKCLALGRYAATIYHSLQIVEIGLVALGGLIGVSDPKSGWAAVTSALKKIVEKPYPQRTDFEKQHSAFLEQVQGTAEALKNAWRNKISHAQGRLFLLSSDFSAEVAEEILVTSRSFMRRLAAEMPSS